MISEKLWRERGGTEWNHSDVVPLRLEGKVRHITGSKYVGPKAYHSSFDDDQLMKL